MVDVVALTRHRNRKHMQYDTAELSSRINIVLDAHCTDVRLVEVNTEAGSLLASSQITNHKSQQSESQVLAGELKRARGWLFQGFWFVWLVVAGELH
jgi:hypothetical protein